MSQISHIPQPLNLASQQPQDVVQFCREAAKKIGQPALSCNTTAGPQAGDGSRTFTIQVLNCVGRACTGVFLVEAHIATTQGGPPGGTQTTAWQTGTLLDEPDATRRFRVLTQADGTCSIRVTASAGQQRVVHAVAIGHAAPSPVASFT